MPFDSEPSVDPQTILKKVPVAYSPMLDSEYSSKRRFLSALFGGKPYRIPVGNVVSVITTELMDLAKAWFPEAHRDACLMAELAATGYTVLGYDTVMPVFSVTQEAAALGCQVNWGASDMMPAVRSHPFAGADLVSLSPDWMNAPEINAVLGALERLRRLYGSHVVIVGKVMGPWSLSYHMVGMEEFLICSKLDSDRVRRILDVLKEVTIAFGKAQMQAGADVICIADHITGGIVSPLVYRDMVLPVHQEIIARLGCPTVLHCCGNTTDRVRYFAQAGFDCYHLESKVNLSSALDDAGGKMRLMGNINNPEVLLGGSPELVAAACRDALKSGIHILAPECAVPLHTPLLNLRVLVQAAIEFANS